MIYSKPTLTREVFTNLGFICTKWVFAKNTSLLGILGSDSEDCWSFAFEKEFLRNEEKQILDTISISWFCGTEQYTIQIKSLDIQTNKELVIFTMYLGKLRDEKDLNFILELLSLNK